MTSARDQAIGLFIFFPILTTITVSLRIYVRTRVNRGSFGWDDVALVVTYIGLLLWVGLASAAFQYPVDSELYNKWDSAKADVCYIISGTVKISVALVLYRLQDARPVVQAVLLTDMIACAVWTVVVTLILALGCNSGSPSSPHRSYYRSAPVPLPESVCEATNYSQEASYVIFDVLHVIIPAAILWNVQLARTLKWSIVALFGVGLLAAFAAVMKLVVYIKFYDDPSRETRHTLEYQTQIWSVTEHGLALFAASVLALKPVYSYISKSWTRISMSLSEGVFSSSSSSSANKKLGDLDSSTSRRTSSRVSGGSHLQDKSVEIQNNKKNLWSVDTNATGTELGTIDVRNDVEVRSEENVDRLRHPAYAVNAYNDSQRRLVDGAKGGLQEV